MEDAKEIPSAPEDVFLIELIKTFIERGNIGKELVARRGLVISVKKECFTEDL